MYSADENALIALHKLRTQVGSPASNAWLRAQGLTRAIPRAAAVGATGAWNAAWSGMNADKKVASTRVEGLAADVL